MNLPQPDSGFVQALAVPSLPDSNAPDEPGFTLDVSGDLTLLGSISLYYDSNVGQSPDTAEHPSQGDFVLGISPSVEWYRESANWRSSLAASFGYNHYFDQDEYSGANYALTGGVAYDGGRWSLATRFSHGFTEGVNRYYSAALSQYRNGFGSEVDFSVSPKTTLNADWTSNWTDSDGGIGETESHAVNLSALWHYSPLLEFGPGVGIKRAGDSYQGERDAVGPVFSATYQLSSKVSAKGRVGLDFVEYSNGGSDRFVSTAIAFNYAASRLWGMNLSLVRGAEADGYEGGGFREATAVRLGVNRRIGRATAGIYTGFESSSYSGGDGGSPREPVDYTSIGLSLKFPVLGDRADFMLFTRWNSSVSEDLSRDWNGMQTGCSFIFEF